MEFDSFQSILPFHDYCYSTLLISLHNGTSLMMRDLFWRDGNFAHYVKLRLFQFTELQQPLSSVRRLNIANYRLIPCADYVHALNPYQHLSCAHLNCLRSAVSPARRDQSSSPKLREAVRFYLEVV
jgi:hypothetical protein